MSVYKLIIYSLPLLMACGTAGSVTDGQDGELQTFTVVNSSDRAREDVLVSVSTKELSSRFPDLDWSAVHFTAGETEIPFQVTDTDGNGSLDEIALLLDLAARERKTLTVRLLKPGESAPEFPKRTQAEISHKINGNWQEREYMGGDFQNVDALHVPPEHTDHSWFIRYEGPGWESDLVGYRFYLDWRNATDIFGKKTDEMVLQKVGLDGFDSYHEPADWGQDILKVGKSLGVGSIASWIDGKALRVEETDSLFCEIVENGDIRSTIRTHYYGWKAGAVKTDLTSDISIHAGSRLSRQDITLSKALPNICTGIVKLDNSEILQDQKGDWGYLATWGEQSLAEDQLGMAVIYRVQDLQQVTEDEFSHVVVLTPKAKKLTYYFLGAWEQEQNGITSKQDFKEYLEGVLTDLGSPPAIHL